MESPLREENVSLEWNKLSSSDMFSPRDGLKPSPDKARAAKECGVSENKEAVQSLLGMASYLDSFIQNYAAIAAPLYQLTKKETKGVNKKRKHSEDTRHHLK